jgi:phospholipid/cholesterol/gamma-HCH transport system substrate-binding protein
VDWISRMFAIVVIVTAVSGCSSRFPLPSRPGVGGTTVTVRMADVANLVPNSEVKVADVTVGTITAIRFADWTAELTLQLQPEVAVPANAIARIGQKSLLGAEFLELAPPAEPAAGRLADGDTIPLERTNRYPETEEVLAALSTVLNGGGLSQIKTITTELDAALSGREGDIRALIDNLGTFVGDLDAQKDEIGRAIDGIDRLSQRLAERRDTLATAVQTLPDGLAALEQNRTHLVDGLDAVSRLGTVAEQVITSSRGDLLANLHDLQPALGRLADAGNNLTQSVSILATFPFPQHTAFPAVVKGDYGNLFITVDLDAATLARNFGVGFPAGTDGIPLGALPPLGIGATGGDPLQLPLHPPAEQPAPLPVLPVPLGPVGGSGAQGAGTPDDNSPPVSPAPSGPLSSLLGGG